VKEWQISHSQAKLNLEVKRESNLAVDPGFSSIKVLMTNEEGEVIGSRTVPLVGGELPNGGWIVLGSQPGDGQKPADTEGLDAVPDRLSVYEALQTPYGEATRLLTTLE
jgi:hypothetical protein